MLFHSCTKELRKAGAEREDLCIDAVCDEEETAAAVSVDMGAAAAPRNDKEGDVVIIVDEDMVTQ